VRLPYFIKGEVPAIDDLIVRTPAQFAAQNIRALVHHEVTAIDPATRSVQVHNLQTGQTFIDHWDQLIIATGGVATDRRCLAST
jgi:NADPH-dependent 2,4-dienoyl-CoA reductase/sulfur reductase-like enzyme